MKPLVKSHIFPAFLYKGFGLFNAKGKINQIGLGYKKPNGEFIIKHPSGGIYDDNLMCPDCDNHVLGALEAYASQVLFPSKNNDEVKFFKEDVIIDNASFKVYRNLDYNKFKLFWLSILWRCSVTQRVGFNKIDLGPHENVIRSMLIDKDPSSKDDYLIVIYSLEDDSIYKDFILTPLKIKFLINRISYCLFIGELLIIINISKHFIPPYYRLYALNPEGKIGIQKLKNGEGRNLIESYIKSMVK